MNKKIFLISTIGADENIFKSLKFVIENQRPDKVLYIITNNKEVEENYKKIEEEIKNNYQNIEIDYILLNETENIKKIIDELIKKINLKINDNFDIKIDFTYGKKPISAGLVFWALEMGVGDNFIYVSGERKGEDNKVFIPSEIISIKRQGIFFNIYKERAKLFLKNFRFKEFVGLLGDFLSEETKEMFFYFDDFCRGNFKEMSSQVFKFLFSLGFVSGDLINKNKNEIFRYKKLALSDLSYEEALFAFKLQSFYFYDLIFSYYKRKEFNEILSLFVNFLDNIFNYLIIKIKKELKTDKYFVDFQEGFLLKQIIGSEKKPMSISRKIELLNFYKSDFFNFFDRKLIDELIYKRNNSIFGHGYGIVEESDVEKILKLRKYISKKIFDFGNDIYFWYPANVDLEVFFR